MIIRLSTNNLYKVTEKSVTFIFNKHENEVNDANESNELNGTNDAGCSANEINDAQRIRYTFIPISKTNSI